MVFSVRMGVFLFGEWVGDVGIDFTVLLILSEKITDLTLALDLRYEDTTHYHFLAMEMIWIFLNEYTYSKLFTLILGIKAYVK